tara:strand:- start:1626 stop:2219 length:594 start_codon:yes stop_codon:yes gene_type:complete
MENGNYKSSDTNVSTEDWIALNFRAVDSSIVQAVIGDEGYDMLTRVDLEAPEEPDEDDFESEEEYEEAVEEYEEKLEEFENETLHGYPAAWGTMWGCLSTGDIEESLRVSGFVVYDTSGPAEDFGAYLFGVDGGGYNFYAAHWIPLRATICQMRHENGYLQTEAFEAIIQMLAEEQSRCGGDSIEKFTARYLKLEAA